MKQIILFGAILILALSEESSAQTGKNPELSFWVSNAFQRDFQNAKNVSWEKLNDTYVASFITRKNEMKAYYQNDGNLVGTSRSVVVDDLPDEIIRTIGKRFREYTIQNAVEYSPYLLIAGNSLKEHALGIDGSDEGTLYFLQISDAQSEKLVKVPTRGNIEILKVTQKG